MSPSDLDHFGDADPCLRCLEQGVRSRFHFVATNTVGVLRGRGVRLECARCNWDGGVLPSIDKCAAVVRWNEAMRKNKATS